MTTVASTPATNSDTAGPTASATTTARPGWPNRSGNNPPINAPRLAGTPGVANNPATAAPTASPTTEATGTSPSNEATNADTVTAAYCCTSASAPNVVINTSICSPNAVHNVISPSSPLNASVVTAPRPS